MADGSLRIEVEVEPQDAQQAFALFGRPGAPMALAALAVGHAAAQEPEPEKPKGGERAKWVAMRCNDATFRQWLFDTFAHPNIPKDFSDIDAAAAIVRDVCGVESRAELDSNKYAAVRFDTLIRKPWAEHNGVTA